MRTHTYVHKLKWLKCEKARVCNIYQLQCLTSGNYSVIKSSLPCHGCGAVKIVLHHLLKHSGVLCAESMKHPFKEWRIFLCPRGLLALLTNKLSNHENTKQHNAAMTRYQIEQAKSDICCLIVKKGMNFKKYLALYSLEERHGVELGNA